LAESAIRLTTRLIWGNIEPATGRGIIRPPDLDTVIGTENPIPIVHPQLFKPLLGFWKNSRLFNPQLVDLVLLLSGVVKESLPH
jgi:hypothetical protein